MKKGQRIQVTGNSIFKMMGMETVTGTIALIREDQTGCSIQCDQTRCYETLDFDDGEIKILDKK